jgi:hypothetical protein
MSERDTDQKKAAVMQRRSAVESRPHDTIRTSSLPM